MQTETIQIEITGLPLGAKTALEEVGRSRGKSFPDYLRDLLQNELLSEKPFSEILEPIRRSFDESGMSEAELDTLFESARDKRVPCEPMPDDTREMNWIEEHKHEYAGQWVALDGDRLIAASSIQQEVWDAVKADPATLPLVHRISSPDDLPYIGI